MRVKALRRICRRARRASRARSLSTQLLLLVVLFLCAAYVAQQLLPPRRVASARAELHHVLLLDGWERMVNIQYALRRLVHVAADANFTLVEPFMYHSKVSLKLSLPQMFAQRNLSAQPASTYFDSDTLFATQRYAPFRRFEQRFARQDAQAHFIHVVLFLTWRGHRWQTLADRVANALHRLPPPFFWCDSNARRLPGSYNRTSRRHHLTRDVQVGRIVCASASELRDARFFHTLFHIARAHVRAPPLRAAAGASVALANFRKHALARYLNASGGAVSAPVAPLAPSRRAFALARALLQSKGRGEQQPFVALQLRSGKAYTALLNRRRVRAFQTWLPACVQRLLRAAAATRLPVFVASDVFNDGWKGGERATRSARAALRDARERLRRNGTFWLDGATLGQDRVGMAAAVDAAVAVLATHFIFAEPSNMGAWVRKLRAERGAGSSTVSCAFS